MSEAIAKRIKQLETQNEKFKKLLESTLKITGQDSSQCLLLQNETDFLLGVVSDLEEQKKQLEDELQFHLDQDPLIPENKAKVDIHTNLNKALHDVQKQATEVLQLDTEDEYLKTLLSDLKKEKESLLTDINLVKKANDENQALVQENLKLRQELAMLQSKSVSPRTSGQDLINKLASIENVKQQLEKDIQEAQKTSDPLGVPVENTVLELKIAGLNKQKNNILNSLKAKLLQSANEISMLHCTTSDGQLRGLLNELDLHKTILMMNLNDVKEMYSEAHIESVSSEVIQNVTEIDQTLPPNIDLPTVSEETEHDELKEQVSRLERERNNLLQQIQTIRSNHSDARNELHDTFMREESSEEIHRLPLDDATNQMFIDEEQLLSERIRELEEDNERIRTELGALLDEAQDSEVLEQGQRLINDFNNQ